MCFGVCKLHINGNIAASSGRPWINFDKCNFAVGTGGDGRVG